MVDMNLRVILTAASGNFKTQLDNTMRGAGESLAKSTGETLSRIFRGIGGAGGRLGGMLNAFPVGGAAGAAVAGLGAVIGILKMMHDRLDKMLDKLSEASGSFKAARETLDKMFNLTLKPMADVMTALMRPYLILIMRRTRDFLAQIRESGLMQRAMTGDEGAIKEIGNLMEDALKDVAYMTQKMNDVVRPIAGRIEGFKTGIDFIFTDFLTGAKEQFGGLLAGLGTVMRPFPTWLETKLKSGEMQLSELPKNIASDYLNKMRMSDNVVRDFVTGFTDPLIKIVGGLGSAAQWFIDEINRVTSARASGGGGGAGYVKNPYTGVSGPPQSTNPWMPGYVKPAGTNPLAGFGAY